MSENFMTRHWTLLHLNYVNPPAPKARKRFLCARTNRKQLHQLWSFCWGGAFVALESCVFPRIFYFWPGLKFLNQCGRRVFTATDKAPVFNQSGIGSVRHVPCKFTCKMALVKCPCAFRLRRLAQNAGRGISVRHFPVYIGSCEMLLCLSTAKRPLLGSLHRNLAKKPLMEILFGNLSKRPFQENCAEGALIEILHRDLARRPLLQISYGHLVKRAETLLKDFV